MEKKHRESVSQKILYLRGQFLNGRNVVRFGIPFILIVGLYVLGRLINIDAYLVAAQAWIGRLGPQAIVIYTLFYVVATLLFLPGTPFTIIAALLFGPAIGFAVMTVATTLSAALAFLISRHLAKAAIERRLGHTDKFIRLRQLLEDNRWFVIPMIRFLPMFPFSLNNYALGLTNISFGSYLLLSELVFIPMNAVLVLGANALYRAIVLGRTEWDLIGGTTLAGLIIFLLGYCAKTHCAALRRQGKV